MNATFEVDGKRFQCKAVYSEEHVVRFKDFPELSRIMKSNENWTVLK